MKNTDTIKKIKTINLNFGPQHPAAHGVLRLVLQLNGELIEKTDAHIGLLHRGTEKLIENKMYLHSLPYFDRFDYVSMLVQEHAYCLSIEELQQRTNYSSTFLSIRTLFDELTRVLNHMLAVGCHALDVGSMSALFWSFEEREKIMEFYERISGARMHAAFYRPNDLNINVINQQLIDDIVEFCRNCFTTLNEMHNILTYNKIWKQRLVNVGTYSTQTCLDFGLTGVMSRCVGFQRDIRLSKFETYSNYYYLNFRSFIGLNGDSYDRFLIRMNEMVESLLIINQVLSNLFDNSFICNINKYNENDKMYNSDYIEYAPEPGTAFEEMLDNFILKKNKLDIDNGIKKMDVEILKEMFNNSKYSYLIDELDDNNECEDEFNTIFFSEEELNALKKYYPNYYIKAMNKNIDFFEVYSENDYINGDLYTSGKLDFNFNTFKLVNYLNLNKNNSNKDKINYNTMEDTINHFKYWSEGFKIKPGFTYKSVESPKGEFGVSLISNGSNNPYRCKVRSPALHHLQCLPKLAKGHFLADLATLIGTIDIVFGEIDR